MIGVADVVSFDLVNVGLLKRAVSKRAEKEIRHVAVKLNDSYDESI